MLSTLSVFKGSLRLPRESHSQSTLVLAAGETPGIRKPLDTRVSRERPKQGTFASLQVSFVSMRKISPEGNLEPTIHSSLLLGVGSHNCRLFFVLLVFLWWLLPKSWRGSLRLNPSLKQMLPLPVLSSPLWNLKSPC